jgi:hypothetical protein
LQPLNQPRKWLDRHRFWSGNLPENKHKPAIRG